MRQPTFWFLFPLLLAATLLQSSGASKARRKERAFRSHSHDVAAVRTFPTANVEATPSSNLRGSQRILYDDSSYGRDSGYNNNNNNHGSSGSSSSNQSGSSSSSSSSSSNQASSSSSGNSGSSSSTATTYQTYHNCDSSSSAFCTSSNNSQEYEETDEGLTAWEAGMISGALTLVAALLFMICCGCSLYDIFGCAMCNRSRLFDLCDRYRKESPLSVSFADEQIV